jgi:hypothetical protein
MKESEEKKRGGGRSEEDDDDKQQNLASLRLSTNGKAKSDNEEDKADA